MHSLVFEIQSAKVTVRDPAIRRAAEIIRAGGLVAFPTETVYGLGANALDAEAVLRIFAAKQRPAWDPIIVHACSLTMVQTLVRAWPEAARRLAECFMPGPLTLLLPKREIIPDACTAGREKVGIRIPAHPVALALIEAAGVPDRRPQRQPLRRRQPDHRPPRAARSRWPHRRHPRCRTAPPIGVEFTVIDVTAEPPVIYRPGGVSREQVESIIGPVLVAVPDIRTDAPPESLARPASASATTPRAPPSC